MPAGKLYGKKRNYKKSTDAKQNKDIKNLKKDMKTVLQSIETKWFDSVINNSISNTATMIPLLAMPVTTGANDVNSNARSGNSINLLSYSFNGLVSMTNSSNPLQPNDRSNRIRVIVIHSPDSTTPVPENILDPIAYDIDSHYKIKPEFTYSIVYNRVFNLSNYTQKYSSTTQDFPDEAWRLPIKIRLGKKAFTKSGSKSDWVTLAALTASAPARGALTMMLISDSSVPTHPFIKGRGRVRFDDTA